MGLCTSDDGARMHRRRHQPWRTPRQFRHEQQAGTLRLIVGREPIVRPGGKMEIVDVDASLALVDARQCDHPPAAGLEPAAKQRSQQEWTDDIDRQCRFDPVRRHRALWKRRAGVVNDNFETFPLPEQSICSRTDGSEVAYIPSHGIHAVFGGFLLGTAMPRGFFATELKKQLEPFTVVFLLPMFFTYSGLKTQLNVVTSPELLFVTLVVLAASIGGKGIACWAAARLSGEDNRTSLAIGTLMNSRGLMELIINIALERKIIEPTLFSMLVVMAIVTTLMASPLFELVYGRHARKEGTLGEAPLGG